MTTGIVRITIIAALLSILAVSPVAAAYQNGVPVLLYHHVTGDSGDMPDLTITPTEFQRQMAALKAAGFRTISPDQLLAYMKGDPAPLPDKPVLITFDDGYTDNYTNAFPILKQYDFQATLFMVGINFDRPNRLSSSQIRDMASGTFTIGSHSMTHPDLTALTPAELERQVAGSKQKAEAITHKPVDFFAYPGGFYAPSTVTAVEAAGYKGAFSVLTGLNLAGRDNIYLLRRIPVFRDTDFDRLLALLTANHPKTSLLDFDPVLPDDTDLSPQPAR